MEGIVVEADSAVAKVKLGRHAECKDCGACPGNEAQILEAANIPKAKVGQRVLVEIKEEKVLKGAFLIFIFPLIALFAGVFLGGLAADLFSISGLLGKTIGGVLFFGVAILVIRLIDRNIAKKANALPNIIKIIS